MYPDPGPSSPRVYLDTTSEFFQVLTAPYHPPSDTPVLHRTQPRSDHVARCHATINWTSSPPTETTPTSQQVATRLDQPIYQPHGRWAWTHGFSIDDPKQLLSLQKGAQCTASIDSGTVANKEIKYICRKWKLSTQKEWYGFYSELALYKSDQYLRPLQGVVVPHIIGVHVMPEAVSITMEMPHASFWIESSPSMPHALKERVIAAFEKIHAQGVLHGDPELRHMLIGADGRVMIIDFGMSRAIREHASLGIERAEPEEFRLEMRKVKYKLDYMGARKKEGNKVDNYLRLVRRNRKISELWKRRAKGERVGPIPQYEEEPEEYALDPPVNAQDFQEDWMTASDDSPMRVIVPGQTSEQVANEVQAFIWKLEEICSTFPSLSAPRSGSPWSSPASHCHPDHQERAEHGLSPYPLPDRLRTKDKVRSHITRHRKRHIAEPGSSSHRCEDELSPLCARHIEGTSRRRDYIRHKHVRNTYISSVSNDPGRAPTFPSSIDAPENPRSLKPEEYERIQESRRQAMVQYSRAPRGILKRRRDDDAVENKEMTHPPCKRLRFCERVAPRGRTPFDSTSSRARRSRVIGYSRAYKRLTSSTRPQLVDFTLPSLRTLSTLVGSLMPWVHCRG